MGEHFTAEIVRVASGPSCWRLVIWKHEPIKRFDYDRDEIGHVVATRERVDDLATIYDVWEVDLKRYHVLRKIAENQGFRAPTLVYVQNAIQRALGPPDHDQGATVGKVVVREWNALDDHREYTHKLTVHLSPVDSDGNERKIILHKIETGEERQIG